MKNWHLHSEDPGSYSIAADVRFGNVSYTNDQIWSLDLDGGEPPALAIRTTFGLRAKNLRLFPRFAEGDSSYVDPVVFHVQPFVKRFFPNYLEVNFSPIEGIDVISEYWVPTSNTLLGRVTVKNSRLNNRSIKFQWNALLSPAQDGQRMAPMDLGSTTILSGQTGGLFPVLSMTGAPESSSGPYPALSVTLDLLSGDSRKFTWAHVASDSIEDSFNIANQWLTKSWDSELVELEVLNSGNIEIITGNADWNAALALSQKNALNYLVGPTDKASNISFVQTRGPDQGYSNLGDGSDYNYLWDGQTPIDSYFLSTFLLPAHPNMVIGFLENFLDTQNSQGFVNYKTGLGGQRENLLATPILVSLAWRIFQSTEDITFLETVFPKLLKFIQAWFRDIQDRDGDGLPEWDRPSQSGYEENPLFSPWDSSLMTTEISKIESPSLCSFLYHEIQILIKMAKLLENTSPIAALEAFSENLKTAVERSWHTSRHRYHNWDRESHLTTRGEVLGQRIGSGEIVIDREFNPPVRPVFRLETKNERTVDIRIFIHGAGSSGNQRIERIESDQMYWYPQQANATCERIYSSIEYIEVIGANPEDSITVGVVDLFQPDITLLLPLWAEIPDKKQASDLLRNTIHHTGMFWKPYGLPSNTQEVFFDNQPSSMVHMIWNNFVGEALLKYNFRREAADLVTRLMNAVIVNLKKHNAFFNYYNPITGSGYGDRNSLKGLAPVSLFLKVLGVEIISPYKIILRGKNPFPWPVTVHYRGLTVSRENQRTTISFPGGQTAIVKSEEPRIIQIEHD